MKRCSCGLELFARDNLACRSCDKCDQCKGPLGERLYLSDYGTDEVFCSKNCRESFDDSQSEKAYERFCSSFYGGEIATLDEQHRNAWEEKRRLS